MFSQTVFRRRYASDGRQGETEKAVYGRPRDQYARRCRTRDRDDDRPHGDRQGRRSAVGVRVTGRGTGTIVA